MSFEAKQTDQVTKLVKQKIPSERGTLNKAGESKDLSITKQFEPK